MSTLKGLLIHANYTRQQTRTSVYEWGIGFVTLCGGFSSVPLITHPMPPLAGAMWGKSKLATLTKVLRSLTFQGLCSL